MSDEQGPWTDYQPPTPAAPDPNTKPWEDFAALGQPQQTPAGYVEPHDVDNPPAGAEVPVEAKLFMNAEKAAQGFTAAELPGRIIGGIGGKVASLLEAPESLKSAGITAKVIENMAPGGQNPADYVEAVQQQLQNANALGKSAKQTWDLMNPLKEQAGQAVQNALNAIKQAAGPEGVMVDATQALDPLATEALKRGTGLYSKTENLANPFYQAYDGLMSIAKQQGGKLSLDNLDAALKETGQMMDEGGETAQATFGKVYGRLADVRDSMVNQIANQVGDDTIKTNLLKSNADYSTYMRLLPAVEKAGFKEAIKEGVSAYQKYGGPLVAKLATGYGMAKGVQEVIDKVLGH